MPVLGEMHRPLLRRGGRFPGVLPVLQVRHSQPQPRSVLRLSVGARRRRRRRRLTRLLSGRPPDPDAPVKPKLVRSFELYLGISLCAAGSILAAVGLPLLSTDAGEVLAGLGLGSFMVGFVFVWIEARTCFWSCVAALAVAPLLFRPPS